MVRKVLRFFIALLGAAIGAGLVILTDTILVELGVTSFHISLLTWALILVYVLSASILAILFYIISPSIIDGIAKIIRNVEETLTSMPLTDVVSVALGLCIGLLLAFLFSTLINKIPWPWLSVPLTVLTYLILGYLGISTALRRRVELRDFGVHKNSNRASFIAATTSRPKILDTSVIIDGRIFDICQTGIVEGVLMVPGFVLQELRHIADSSDSLKRTRGRRGLDILQKMQKELDIPVRINETDYEENMEVDLKLLKLAQELGGVVVTNDYNLNKVAAVQNVQVLNINELANAIRPVVLPGEEMRLTIIKEGKESGQGIGYLEDGTMIVVEGGRRLIGEEIDACVTSVLQTSAGRMIFAKVKA